jgi:hypothetical protein
MEIINNIIGLFLFSHIIRYPEYADYSKFTGKLFFSSDLI